MPERQISAITLPGDSGMLGESLGTLRRYVTDVAQTAGLSTKSIHKLRLAIDEIATNIIVHGYDGTDARGALEVRAAIADETLTITLDDTGLPYNPLTRPSPSDLETPLEARQEGGLGVYLVRTSVDDLRYERVGDRNRNTVVMKRPHLDRLEKLADQMRHVVLPIGLALSAETDFDRLMERILVEAKSLCRADAGTLYLRCDGGGAGHGDALRFAIVRTDSLGIALGGTTGKAVPFPLLRLHDQATGAPNHRNVATSVALTGQSISIPDVYTADGFDFSGTKAFDRLNSYRSVSILTVPLKDHEGRVTGVLQLLNARTEDGTITAFDEYDRAVVESLSSLAAVALNNHLLIQRQQTLVRIEHDIQIARRIHEGFLPATLPAIEGWQIDARYRPAREVGGDFYDAFTLGNGRFLAVVVADICDKGVGAALFMALTRSLIRAFAEQHDHTHRLPTLGEGTSAALTHHVWMAAAAELASAAVTSTNAYILAHHLDLTMFATVFVGIVDVASGALVYVNAGHCSPIVLSAGGGVARRLPPTGPAVGMFADAEFAVQEDRLAPGDTLLAFSDGATDARNAAGTLFGEAGLTGVLSDATSSAAALLDVIESGVRNHIGDEPPYDDLTLLALRRHISQPTGVAP